jgi:hypothetical protein
VKGYAEREVLRIRRWRDVPLFAFWLTAGGASACAGAQIERKSFDRTGPTCTETQSENARPFSVLQAKRALDKAEIAVHSCSPAAAEATGRVVTTWGNPGCVLRVKFELEGPALTPEYLDCIATAFVFMRMDPFVGEPVTTSNQLGPAIYLQASP